MSQKDDSENDIWEYKPLEKRKKRGQSPAVTKRRCTSSRKTSKKKKKDTSLSAESPNIAKAAESGDCGGGVVNTEAHHPPSKSSPATNDTVQTDQTGPSSGDFCPMCQMPFSILVVQTQRWHVAECLETPRDTCKECPDGFQCSSTIPNHYKKFNHTLLAHSRANSDAALLSLSQKAETSSVSPLNNHTGTPPSKPTNGLLFLRSPGPEDFKKKKGWSSSSKKSLSSSQERRAELSSTPVRAEGGRQDCEDLPKSEPSPDNDYAISYSPLSELPAETEVQTIECRKSLFNNDASENETEDSLLFSDSFSSEDELLAEFVDNLETSSVQVKEPALVNTQLEPITSLQLTNQPAASSVSGNRSDSTASPQVPSSQASVVQRSQTMPPQRGQSKAGQASSLKQTDIGVFFGLKPLKEKEKEAESGPKELSSSSVPTLGENSRQRRPRRERQRRSKADTTSNTSQGAATADSVTGAPGEAGKGRTRGWRRRWNRVNADGEVELPRCPFYKKIPGTKFVIDAFRYGEIAGITAYFLTHFHSDHYGGLTKNFTLPIYCNRITGNLVKSKLKVAEQHVHILPMNTQVTVEGVKVILLDANHCPGAAMLLFFLPDGQTVLHTGDFRADPSMETYPELLSCRVQTLYLDTTYCSPEYTFPRQQEVISFAASTAFELVTLNPRTLVVCGSYSVGKEKVFLALAEALGSKVCLSRDKYNTMCCLESEEIRQRITTDWKAAQVHVLPMMQLSFKKLQDHLARFSGWYDQLVAFKPTGWTFSQQVESVEDIQPEISSNISIYAICHYCCRYCSLYVGGLTVYLSGLSCSQICSTRPSTSEPAEGNPVQRTQQLSGDSSYLKRFVQWLQPLKIIPTVNNGSWASKKAMEKCFKNHSNQSSNVAVP
ncbi:hypothetical protein L3Q82_001007 [Scortum barcoo]|uniref:Uncharacterized protein n=1 Tax=Scortum barcoo TaxID=214431 RepID=A0ACB8WAS6_9TELE|nr:hypothetical protein L3Q82_001007 [Scortum barcoo]